MPCLCRSGKTAIGDFAPATTRLTTIDVEKADGSTALGHPFLSQSATKPGGSSVRRQASQFAP
ncbi:MAG TPA: hypothetical protein VEL06_15120 [Haliangiales bacterium]|nr:hypothetical protein [Haliangiales bacterium]